jgi:penicillin-binding protein 2
MALQDYAMRRVAEEESVAVVLMDAITGEVLVMASSPAYDDNTFSHGLTDAVWHQLITDPHTPLSNKTIQGVYPPGSTFKPCTAMAALDSGAITPDFKVTCTGQMRLGDAIFHCWWKGGHGTLDLHGGIKHSCDIYFYQVAQKVGVDKIAAMAHRLGFGQPTGIDIPNERPGLIPTRAWKLATTGVSWQDGETLSVGIGQGYVSATPLQLATMLSRLISNKQVVPHLVRTAGLMRAGGAGADDDASADNTVIDDDGGNQIPVLGFDPAHLAAVLGGMNAVVNEKGGTAYSARIEDPAMAMGGKSGTAQVRHITMAERAHGLKNPEDIPWIERDHALFIAFAPVSSPRYVCAVVVEHGIGGAKYAAPIARDLLIECQKRDPGRNVPPDPGAEIPYVPSVVASADSAPVEIPPLPATGQLPAAQPVTQPPTPEEDD